MKRNEEEKNGIIAFVILNFFLSEIGSTRLWAHPVRSLGIRADVAAEKPGTSALPGTTPRIASSFHAKITLLPLKSHHQLSRFGTYSGDDAGASVTYLSVLACAAG